MPIKVNHLNLLLVWYCKGYFTFVICKAQIGQCIINKLNSFWTKKDIIKKATLNAKIETATEKPAFKNSTGKRCLIIANGFYEWQWLDPKGKQKYLILVN